MFRRFAHRTAIPDSPACLPPGARIYAVGDIHGRKDCLEKIRERIREHRESHPVESAQIIFLGDYVDRGPGSKEVVQTLLDMQKAEPNVLCLMGNHEWALLRFLDGMLSYDDWYPWGGDTTLESYGIDPVFPEEDHALSEDMRRRFAGVFPIEHETFLRGLPLHHVCGDYIFVHAGLRPHIALQDQVAEDLLTIRKDFLQRPVTIGQTIIHGHTIFEAPHIRERSIGIDTGAYASGRLTAIVLEGSEYQFLTT